MMTTLISFGAEVDSIFHPRTVQPFIYKFTKVSAFLYLIEKKMNFRMKDISVDLYSIDLPGKPWFDVLALICRNSETTLKTESKKTNL